MGETMHVRPFVREAGWQLPQSLDELVAATDPVRFVAAYVDGLTASDWMSLGIRWQEGGQGAHGYHPAVLLSAWIWGFMTGIRSSRHLEAACALRLDLRWLTGSQVPDHNTLWRFYQAHRAGMRYLLAHSIHVAVRAGLVDLAVQAVDGSKLVANAARDRSYDATGLDRLYERVEQAITDLEAQNGTDGASPRARLPEDLATAQALAERVRQARETLEPGGRINLTDRDARFMKTRAGILPGYNAQAVVSPLATARSGRPGMVITGAAVTTDTTDHEQLAPLLDAARTATGQQAAFTLADGGYYSGANLAAAQARGAAVLIPEEEQRPVGAYHKDRFVADLAAESYTCPEGQTLRRGSTKERDGHLVTMYRASAHVCRACPAFGRCTVDATHGRTIEVSEYDALLQAHRHRMATAEARAGYARRRELIEPVFGIIKERHGGRRLLLRGLEAVRTEWLLLAAAFNLRTLARIWASQPALVLPG